MRFLVMEEEDEETCIQGIPAFPAGLAFRDGSILADIPLTQMRRQFGVNQYIVTQTNPHVRYSKYAQELFATHVHVFVFS